MMSYTPILLLLVLVTSRYLILFKQLTLVIFQESKKKKKLTYCCLKDDFFTSVNQRMTSFWLILFIQLSRDVLHIFFCCTATKSHVCTRHNDELLRGHAHIVTSAFSYFTLLNITQTINTCRKINADELLNACNDIGLAVNIGKTKYMEIGHY